MSAAPRDHGEPRVQPVVTTEAVRTQLTAILGHLDGMTAMSAYEQAHVEPARYAALRLLDICKQAEARHATAPPSPDLSPTLLAASKAALAAMTYMDEDGGGKGDRQWTAALEGLRDAIAVAEGRKSPYSANAPSDPGGSK